MRIGRLAERQHGVVALRQLQLLGLSKSAVSRRARGGRFHRIHRGVYAVGHPKLTGYGHWMAAVLACGPRRALSHRSSAGLWVCVRTTDARATFAITQPIRQDPKRRSRSTAP